jgi:uncharacterized protein YdeI (YjbR/CyaY-like superfamily)
MTKKPEPLSIEVTTRAQLRAWLLANHGRTTGVWLVTWKKGSGKPSLAYGEAVEEALCFGWVDSKPGVVDARRTKRWLAPRKPGSGWSKLNKTRIAALTRAGLMHASGRSKIRAARKDGTWSKLDEVEKLLVPADLARALAANPGAAANFEAFPRSVKRNLLEWIVQAKKAETRLARVTTTATLAAKNQRANQWPR